MSATLALVKGQGPPSVNGNFDPNSGLETNQYGDSIFPCAMYRTQVPNANFPVTSGDAIQVSPLMEKIAYEISSSAGSPTRTIIHDPFIGVSQSSVNGGIILWLWIRDNPSPKSPAPAINTPWSTSTPTTANPAMKLTR